MFLVNILTHTTSLHKNQSRSKLRGIRPKRLSDEELLEKKEKKTIVTNLGSNHGIT